MDSYSSNQDIPIPTPILLDGGTGTGLEKYGYTYDEPLSLFASEHPDALISLQQSFIDSGSQILYTATFGANAPTLEKYGMVDKVTELNEKAAKITYDAFHDKVLIAGCISSTGLYIEPYGETTFTELMSFYREQIKALSPYCDMFVIETMPTLWNMRAAVLACKKESKPIIATMRVDENGDTDIGTNVLSALIVLQELGISAFGINCTRPEICADLIREIAQYAKIPLIVKPCAVYTDESGRHEIAPDDFARLVRLSLENGAEIIGGCCGAVKEHIARLGKLLKGFDFSAVQTEKQDMSLVFATENQVFFLDPDTTEFSPPIECEPDMTDTITDVCDESYDVLTVSINSPDDAIDFAKNMHMSTLPVSFLSDDEISLKMALMLYQGRAIVDTKSLIETEKLEKIAEKYGAVLY